MNLWLMAAFIVPGVLAWFAILWTLIMVLIRWIAGMKVRLDIDPGALQAESGWGTAVINGARLKNCLKIERYRQGWLLRAMWLAGDGKLWLDASRTVIGPVEPAKGFFPESRTVTCDGKRIVLVGELMHFMRPPGEPSAVR